MKTFDSKTFQRFQWVNKGDTQSLFPVTKQSISFDKVNEKDPHKWLLKFIDLLQFVSNVTKWHIDLPKDITEIHRGLVFELPGSNEIPVGKFDQFMFDEGIFSHAITGNQTMRFTKLISIDKQITSYRQIRTNNQSRLNIN